MIPYAHIIEKADRRWTGCLMQRFHADDLTDEQLESVIESLQMVADPRSFGMLRTAVCDLARPARIREAASAILRGLHHIVLDESPDTLRRWWQEGDAVLRRHALLSMDGIRCSEIVLQVASDSTHPFQAEALARMIWDFDRPPHQAIKITGLAHPDPKVREVAAYVLLWDEPVAAEGPLLAATHDAIPEVAEEAANTLEYYPSRRVLRRLHELLTHPDDRVREKADESFQSLHSHLLFHLSGRERPVAEHVHRWLRPVWDILTLPAEDPIEEEDLPVRGEETNEVLPAGDLLALLADPDISPLTLTNSLCSNGWSRYSETDRKGLRSVLLSHTDPLVRQLAAQALADWKDTRGLLELVQDANFLVRKSAMYNLGQMPPGPGIAEFAWNHLHKHDTLGVHATETLTTYVRHAETPLAIERLGGIAGDHGYREGLRAAAIHHLTNLGAAEMVSQLTGLLQEPPAVTWVLHLALLEAIVFLDLPTPKIGPLQDVDNLPIQVALARLSR